MIDKKSKLVLGGQMNQNNIISRFTRSISDFSFSNVFIPEKTSKAWWFVFKLYLVFLVIMIGAFIMNYQSSIKEDINALDQTITMMPDFTIDSEGFAFVDGTQSGVYKDSKWKVVVGLENENPLYSKKEADVHHLFINKQALYYDYDLMIDFTIFPTTISKAQVLQAVRDLEKIIYTGLIFACFFGLFFLFMLSLGVWLVMIIIKGFVKKEMTSKDCYKVGLYAMTLPNMVLTFIWVTGLYVPGFTWLYVGLVSYYGYKFIKNYQPASVDLSHIYY